VPGEKAMATKRPYTGTPFERSQHNRPDKGTTTAVKTTLEGKRPVTVSVASILGRDPSTFRYTGKENDIPEPGDYSFEVLEIAHDCRDVDFGLSLRLGGERKLYPPACDRFSDRAMEANPGPGTYEHIPAKTPTDHPGKLPAGSGGGGPPVQQPPFGSDVPQLSTAQPFVPTSASTALTPGPGSYTLGSTLDGYTDEEADGHNSSMASTGGSKQLAFSQYRSSTTRDGWWRPVSIPFTDPDSIKNPGPGHYPSSSSFKRERSRRARSVRQGERKKFVGVHMPHTMKSLEQTDGAVVAGFNSSQPRLPESRKEQAADQCTYDRDGALGQSISANLREPAKVGLHGAFGMPKDSNRFGHNSPLHGTAGLGEPALLHADIVKGWGDAAGGSFRSGLPRLPDDISQDRAPKPGPGEYAPITKPNYRSGFRKPKIEHVSFGTCSQRFGSDETQAPPPGAYDARLVAGNQRGGCKSSEDRGLDPKTALKKDSRSGLDPGTYNVATDLIRKTFNVTNESIADMLQTPSEKRPPPQGAFPWASGSTWRPRQVLALEEAKAAQEATDTGKSEELCATREAEQMLKENAHQPSDQPSDSQPTAQAS